MPKRIAALLPLILVAGCAAEPFERPGTWRATGANEQNLRAMVANPADLERGQQATTPARGDPAASAATRLSRRTGGVTLGPASQSGTAGIQTGGAPGMAPAGGNNVGR